MIDPSASSTVPTRDGTTPPVSIGSAQHSDWLKELIDKNKQKEQEKIQVQPASHPTGTWTLVEDGQQVISMIEACQACHGSKPVIPGRWAGHCHRGVAMNDCAICLE